MGLRILLWLCIAVSLRSAHCTKESDDAERARLPELLTELDLASLEASEEDIDALKKVVKRLAPSKNGLGQPGVDFPMLTTIPTTTFSCRGVKGGYYADLETNCQVFHICDNGRKISFLCPNGTIFQQSQLICDWWFKVDCSKSTELYEQSAEQLAQEEKKRADFKRVNSEFHRTDNNNYQNTNYDGKQNGRTNPYGPTKNQLEQRNSDSKSSRPFDPNQIYNKNARSGNQFSQINDLALNSNTQETDEKYQQSNNKSPQSSRTSNYQNTDRQQNQLIEDRNGKQFQDQRGSNKYSSQVDNYYTTPRDNFRSPKARPLPRDEEINTNRATPAYTETTTFRTSTPAPIREYQQPAESAGFASSRNRYNKPYNSNQYNNYNPATNSPPTRRSTSPPITPKTRQETPQGILKPKERIPDFPYPTFAPIYRPRTSTYESTTQTTSPPYTSTYYNQDRTTNWDPTTNAYTTGQDYRTTTETIYPDDITATYQGARITSTSYTDRPSNTDYTATTPNPPNTYGNSDTYDNNLDTRDYSRTYTTRTSQRYSTGSPSSGFTSAITKSTINDVTVDQNSLSTRTQDEKLVRGGKTSWKSAPRSFQNYRQNAISPSTEKPRTSQVSLQSQTSKTSPPYDTSITYQNGKVMSTLGPYVPFTKNYAYTTTSTTTTQRPPVYTATVPTYSSTAPQYRSSGKPGRIQYPASVRSSSTYLPDVNSTVKSPSDSKSLIEREHAFNMLESLRGLEGTMPTIIGNTSRSGLTIPHSSSPATLHSLALYFATASDEFGGSDQRVAEESSESSKKTNKTSKIDLPTSILTQHTINSYAELFNLNNALENSPNSTESEQLSGEIDSSDDLDLQQSEGPVTSAKKSNSTKLRELAQVFTHALSAYLQDPVTFKKILAEIRPTEPPVQNEEDFTTTSIPTTSEDYPSVTKEKDEVLEFSEDVTAPRRPILQTTEIPTTTDDAAFGYYTTSVTSSESQYSTPSSDSTTTQDYLNPTNDFASAVNHAFDSANGIQSLSGPSGPTSNDALNDYDNYFPADTDANRVGDIQRNSTYEPYGKYVKPVNSVPIGDNYVSSSTPPTYEQTLPPDNSNGITEIPDATTTVEPFRIRYYDTTTIRAEDSNEESLVTANSIYSSYNNYNRLNPQNDEARPNSGENQQSNSDDKDLNNHWTSSPTVTQLWESTVFLDPKRINQGLTSSGGQTSSIENFGNDASATTHSSVPELLVTDSSSSVTPRNVNGASTWSTNTSDDAPTAFSLLPTYSTEHTATPSPLYTTKSSITTTITSSVISTSTLPQEVLFPSKARIKNNNATENEIVRAKQMFGSLNDSSSDALMRVMKTADKDPSVRQLVLLLISHCSGPMNKTKEEEKEHLLNSLLSMPVNQFESEESRGLVAGLNRLNIPDDLETHSTTAIVTSTEPVVTTFRSKRTRRIKSNGDESSPAVRVSEDSKDQNEVSDGRALELLRSLYTVAAKWG